MINSRAIEAHPRKAPASTDLLPTAQPPRRTTLTPPAPGLVAVLAWALVAAGVGAKAAPAIDRTTPSAEYRALVGAADDVPDDVVSVDILPDNPTLADYLRHAALRSPGLHAAYYDWIAAVEVIPQARSLPDPHLSYAYYFQPVETRVGAQRQRVGVEQQFPWLSKLALRGDVAAAEAEGKRARFEAARVRLFYRVTDAYAEYYYLKRAIDITRENIDLLRYTEKLAQAKYRVATGGYQDIIKVQVELGRLTDRLRTLEELRGPLVARLNAAIDRPPTSPLPWPATLDATPAAIDHARIDAELGRTSPELRALDAAVTKEAHAIELAEKDYLPDITFGLQWIDTASRSVDDLSDNGQDAVIGSVSFNLPVWWQKYGAGVRGALARHAGAGVRRLERERELGGGLALALYEFQDAERKLDLYGNGLIPKAEESLAATFTAYESGEADFLDLLDAQRVLLEFRLAHERALADREQHLAESEMLLGRSLTAPPEADATEVPDEQ